MPNLSLSSIWSLITCLATKEFFRTCNVLPFSCTHLALWRQRQGKRPKVYAKQKGFKNFFTCNSNFDLFTFLLRAWARAEKAESIKTLIYILKFESWVLSLEKWNQFVSLETFKFLKESWMQPASNRTIFNPCSIHDPTFWRIFLALFSREI